MGQDEAGTPVSLDYSRKGPESWIWRFGQINERIETAEDQGRDWSQLFWQLWKHCYAYGKKQSWFMELWTSREELVWSTHQEAKDKMVYALALMNDIAAEHGWNYSEEDAELKVPGLGG